MRLSAQLRAADSPGNYRTVEKLSTEMRFSLQRRALRGIKRLTVKNRATALY